METPQRFFPSIASKIGIQSRTGKLGTRTNTHKDIENAGEREIEREIATNMTN